jgi:serine phosphatase RsbU (regulator of sigma subunit)
VARQASISVEYSQLHKEMLKQARLRKEMEFAREVQHHFLPKIPPESKGYRFWAHYSAAGKVGGDYYDFVQLPNGNQAVLLGDVCGKGVPAALMMAKLTAVCKVALLSQPDRIADAMTAINNEVCEASLDAAFVTLVLCVIDPAKHEITLANAGHMSPLVRRADGTIDAPADREVRGYPLGVHKNADYKTAPTALAPGESMLLYSDGISEAMNSADELYTDERVCEQLAGTQGKTARQIGETLLEDVRCHTGDCEQSDDISLVVFQRA